MTLVRQRWFGVSTVAVAWALGACSDPPAKTVPPTTSSVDADSSSGAGDVTALDLSSADSAPTKQTCPGDPGCACSSHQECNSTGVCADDGQAATGKACAYPFGGGCAVGYVVFTAVVGTGATVCVPVAPKLCNPCASDSDCAASGSSGALCVDHGAAGRFCGIACPAAGCPQGYACSDVIGSSGAKTKQCQPSEQTPPCVFVLARRRGAQTRHALSGRQLNRGLRRLADLRRGRPVGVQRQGADRREL